MTRGNVRGLAFTISLFVYVTLDTLVTAQSIRSHVPPSHPELVSAVLIAARSLQLTAILFLIERLAVHLWARRILGAWAYHSDTGNFGLAEIKLTQGELHYSVELYKELPEIIGALEGLAVAQPFAHVNSHICRYSEDNFETDYHIDYAAVGYPPRRGLLVLIHTRNKHVMTGNWYSTGGATGTEMRAGRLDFLRKDEFLRISAGHPERFINRQQPSTIASPPPPATSL